MMKLTFYALVPMQIGDEIREPGDLVPEAMLWRHRSAYMAENKIAAVLVATLPAAVRKELEDWETENIEQLVEALS